MWIPVLIFCLLAGGAVLLMVLSRQFPRYVALTAVSLPILCLLLWLPLRGQLPFTFTLANWSASGALPDLAWRIDSVTWVVTVWVLLLVSGGQVSGFKWQVASGPSPHLLIPSSPGVPAAHPLIFLLTAVTLAAIWGDSLGALMVGWAVLLMVWGVAVCLWGGIQGESNRFFLKIGLLLAAVLLLWLGATAVLHTLPEFLVGDWPEPLLLAVLAAVLLQMGIWPLAGWRPAITHMPISGALAVSLLPIAAGGVLLVRLAETELGFPAGGLLLTLAGLFGLLRGVRKTWEQLDLPLTAVLYLTVAQTHLLLLTAVWGSAAGALAMLRVFILAGGVLFLAAGRPVTRARWWRAIAPGVALAALAGLPLTAGLAGHVALSEGLWRDGRLLLLLVVVFLQIPLVTAGLRLFWPEANGPSEADGAEAPSLTRTEIIQEAGILLPVLGLISVSGPDWGEVSWLTWLLILAVPVGGVILFRFVPEFDRTIAAVRRAFTFDLPLKQAAAFNQWLHGMGGALQEAAAILEGEGSLIWLLIVILVFLLLR